MASTMKPIAGSDEELVFDAYRQGVSVVTMEQQLTGLLPRFSAGSRSRRLRGTMPIKSQEINLNFAFNDLSKNRYKAKDTLVMWARMGIGDGTPAVPSPADLGPNDISIEYEGAYPGFTAANLGDKSYPAVQFEDTPGDVNVRALSTEGRLSFSTELDGGVGTATTDTPFSISLWVNFDSSALAAIAAYDLFTKGATPFAEYAGQVITLGGGQAIIKFTVRSSGGQAYIQTTTVSSIEENSWAHLAFTYTGIGGASASDGMECYINGVQETPALRIGPTYTGMSPEWSNPLYLGADFVGDNEIPAHMAEFAVWDNALSAEEVLAIYNATQFGTEEYYVRRGGYFPTDAGTHFDDSTVTPRPRLLNPAITGIGSTAMMSGSVVWKNTLATAPLTDAGGSVVMAPNHEMERRDFGQPKFFKDDEPFEDFAKSSGKKKFSSFQPVLYLLDDSSTLMYPLILGNVSMRDPDQFDGVIEPFTIRSRASRLSTEAPFFAHDIRADLLSDASQCSRLNAVPIIQFVDHEHSAFDYYEDGIENFGARLMFLESEEKARVIGPVYPGYLTQAESTINPFVESTDWEEIHTGISIYETGMSGATAHNFDYGNMEAALLAMAESRNDLLPRHHKSSGAGFTYSNNELGTDSLAFGGLLK